MSQLERIYYFHSRLKEEKYPNATDLAELFEVSAATAHRDIAYLRDRLLAPMVFDQQQNGYYYSEQNFRLPFEESANIVLFLGLMTTIAAEMGLAGLPELGQLQNKLSTLAFPEYQNPQQHIHCEWIETEPVENAIFRTVMTGLIEHMQIVVHYAGPKQTVTKRCIDPLKLLNYEGKWYLYGWCHLRAARRLFHLARITEARVTDQPAKYAMDIDDKSLTGVFGIFKGEPKYTVTIHFVGMAAERIARQRWHPDQQMTTIADGLELTLPVADEREIIMKVLQFGSQAQIIEPPHLRRQLAAELQKTLSLYTVS